MVGVCLNFTAPTDEKFKMCLGEVKKETLAHGLRAEYRFYADAFHIDFDEDYDGPVTVVRLFFAIKIVDSEGEALFDDHVRVSLKLNARYLNKKRVRPKVVEAMEELNKQAYYLMNSAQNFYWVYDLLLSGENGPTASGEE